MLEFVVFLSGAVVMILELVASRLLAPYVGTSLVVWTSLIGVILGSLSLGYWWGGRLADRRPEPRMLSLILLAAAGAVTAIAAIQAPATAALSAHVADLRWGSLLAALFFAPPAVLLGVVSPFAARLKMVSLIGSGATVGRLYALSTLGSIAGTFAAGFWLIPTVGSTRLTMLLALVLLLNSVLVAPRVLAWAKLGLLLAWMAVFWIGPRLGTPIAGGRLVVDRDTPYQRLLVFDLPLPNRPGVRVLSMGFEQYHSAMLLDAPEQLPLPYTKFFRLGPLLRPGMRRSLCIGGGAYSYPLDLLRALPQATVDVVQLDPEVTRIAERYFALERDPRLKIHHEDARVFLNHDASTYDAVFLDAFWGRTIPFHLATVECFRRIAAQLSSDGVLLVNLVGAIEGPRGAFFRAEYATLRRVFPQVLVFPVLHPDDGTRAQNVMLVAFRSTTPPALDAPEMRKYASHLWQRSVPEDIPPLTDDFAPVEQYAARSRQP
jgi:spermidine synthase